ncbi:MAG: hypothetical protein AABW45_03625 [Nanoarchaeota archaeon]
MKKGESAITFVFSLIFIVATITIFYALFSLSSLSNSEFRINQINLADIQINLVNYLRTPLQNNENIADLIVSSYYNDDYKKLQEVSGEIFNMVYDKERCPLWNIKGELDDKKFFEYESKFDVRTYTLSPNPRNFIRLFTDKYILPQEHSLDLIFPDNKKAKITLEEGCIHE